MSVKPQELIDDAGDTSSIEQRILILCFAIVHLDMTAGLRQYQHTGQARSMRRLPVWRTLQVCCQC